MNKKILVGLVIACAALVSYAWADDAATKVKLESRYIPESDVNKQAGQLSISETTFDLSHEFKLDNGMPVTVSFFDRHTDLNSDVGVFLPAYLEGRSLGLGTKFPAPFTQSDNYFIGVDVFAAMYTEGWSKNSTSAFRMPFRTYLIYKRDENFIVIAGLSIKPNYDTVVLPIVGFIYKPNDEWTFNIASENPNITYKVSDKTRLLWEGDIINDEYEVTRNGENGRVLFYRELSTGVGVEHDFTSSLSGLVSIGTVFSRQLKYEDDNGKIIPDAGMYVKARITGKF